MLLSTFLVIINSVALFECLAGSLKPGNYKLTSLALVFLGLVRPRNKKMMA
jgi:hypothetical protein